MIGNKKLFFTYLVAVFVTVLVLPAASLMHDMPGFFFLGWSAFLLFLLISLNQFGRFSFGNLFRHLPGQLIYSLSGSHYEYAQIRLAPMRREVFVIATISFLLFVCWSFLTTFVFSIAPPALGEFKALLSAFPVQDSFLFLNERSLVDWLASLLVPFLCASVFCTGICCVVGLKESRLAFLFLLPTFVSLYAVVLSIVPPVLSVEAFWNAPLNGVGFLTPDMSALLPSFQEFASSAYTRSASYGMVGFVLLMFPAVLAFSGFIRALISGLPDKLLFGCAGLAILCALGYQDIMMHPSAIGDSVYVLGWALLALCWRRCFSGVVTSRKRLNLSF